MTTLSGLVTEHLPPPDDLRAALADRYRLERKLGEGGMATVYRAQDLKHDRPVAVKVLKPELAAVLGEQRFLQEIRVTAGLQHPHILGLYDSGSADGVLFYVMPLVEGESLRDRLDRERQLSVDETLRIARQIAGALDFAHRHGVVHRDVKPENILLHDDQALLGDFGIALAVSEAGGGRLTGTGISIGTLQYMSPEQATGQRELDARTDVYALGAVTYEMLAGEPPFTGASPRATLARLMTERPTSIRVLRDAVPPSIDAAVMRALAKEPADRFASTRELAEALAAAEAPAAAARRPVSPVLRRLSALGVVAALVLGGYLVARFGFGWHPTSAVAADIRSIAVLPLDNYSGDPSQDYFAEGMTDELTTALATISQLRVTSRGSAMQFQGKNRPSVPEIAKALQVDAIVEGSVVRVGDKVRITAQLIDARTDEHLWAKSFERSSNDVLALQADFASAIALEINVRLTPSEQSRLEAVPTVDPEAHDAYLRGRYFFNRPSDENLRKAIAEFEEAIRRSPTFAPAYSGLSDAYLWAGYNEGFLTSSAAKPKARAAAERAVELDSTSAEAHTSLAVFRLFYERDWDGAEREFRRALALNPNYAFAHDQYALALAFTGRFAESEAESKRAAELDPLSPQMPMDATVALLFQKDFAGAKALAKDAAQLDPTFFFPVLVEGLADLYAGRAREAIPLFEKAARMDAPAFVLANLGHAYGVAGDRARALATIEELRRRSPGGRAAPYNLALVYLGLGDHARALDYLERALEADSQSMAWLGRDPMFDPLRAQPRFLALMKQLNFDR